ncbi:MAG: Ureidoglycolate lyase [Thelocarpon impressellum]|nr:MAG: Ureidoglycolate lyase [Thelocarpon impressellum]
MPPPLPTLTAPRASGRVAAEPLTPGAFGAFGTVIANPSASGAADDGPAPPGAAVPANQGTALKYPDVTAMLDAYGRARSGRPARAVTSLFVCSPRALLPPGASDSGVAGLLPIKILERHPYTTQTFVPLGLSPSDAETCYLVVVAPTLPSTAQAVGVPAEDGLPDLENTKAFVARGHQAVTYAAGTWHAPMIVLGSEREVAFVVVQYANGEPGEDCQEVSIVAKEGLDGMTVLVPFSGLEGEHANHKATI